MVFVGLSVGDRLHFPHLHTAFARFFAHFPHTSRTVFAIPQTTRVLYLLNVAYMQVLTIAAATYHQGNTWGYESVTCYNTWHA